MLITLLYAVVVAGQAVYWGWHKDRTQAMDDKIWDACVRPGGNNG